MPNPNAPEVKTSDNRPILIGLAGGVGAGKSTVAKLLADLGCVVIDSDARARAALDRPEVRDRLVSWWGPGVLNNAGDVDRARVAEIIFSDENARRRLENLIHPILAIARSQTIARAARSGAPAVVIDAPLIFEAGLDQDCDVMIFVESPRSERLSRVHAERGWGETELDRREKAQTPLEIKRSRSGYVIANSETVDTLSKKVRVIFKEILGKARGVC